MDAGQILHVINIRAYIQSRTGRRSLHTGGRWPASVLATTLSDQRTTINGRSVMMASIAQSSKGPVNQL